MLDVYLVTRKRDFAQLLLGQDECLDMGTCLCQQFVQA